MTGVVVTFEIVSGGSAGIDRIIKVQEYAAVPSILRYVIIESTSRGLLALDRNHGQGQWRADAKTETETLSLPELGIEIPVAELYEDVEFGEGASGGQ